MVSELTAPAMATRLRPLHRCIAASDKIRSTPIFDLFMVVGLKNSEPAVFYKFEVRRFVMPSRKTIPRVETVYSQRRSLAIKNCGAIAQLNSERTHFVYFNRARRLRQSRKRRESTRILSTSATRARPTSSTCNSPRL